MASVSKITIVGNVGRDTELRMTPSGAAVASFSVAVNRRARPNPGGAGGEQRDEETDWYNVRVFGKQADFCQQYVSKGRLVYVDGRFEPREWTDREGKKRTSLDVYANDVQLLGGGGGMRGDREGGEPAERPAPAESGKFDPDEIPF